MVSTLLLPRLILASYLIRTSGISQSSWLDFSCPAPDRDWLWLVDHCCMHAMYAFTLFFQMPQRVTTTLQLAGWDQVLPSVGLLCHHWPASLWLGDTRTNNIVILSSAPLWRTAHLTSSHARVQPRPRVSSLCHTWPHDLMYIVHPRQWTLARKLATKRTCQTSSINSTSQPAHDHPVNDTL